MKKMSSVSRVMIGLAALAMIATYFLPVWAIYLIAPQYPEGLEMNIWLHKLTGEVDIINGLNHYIGMKKISADMFPELRFLVFIIGFFILYGLVVATTGNRKLLASYCLLLILFAIGALVDFYMWGYDYGHNLDPTAPIQVPGLSYQPPVLGHKKLLNFDAYSYPDTGGWVIVGAAVLLFLIWFIEWRKNKKMKQVTIPKRAPAFAGLMLVLFITSCTPKAEKIVYGKDNCSECKMTIMDTRFGGEIISKKGKVFKFDDARCIALFFKNRTVELSDIHQTLFIDYNGGGTKFLKTKEAQFVLSSRLKSPMGSNAAAFATGAEAEKTAVETDGKTTNWATLYNVLIK
jgi:copper chaperone NosL